MRSLAMPKAAEPWSLTSLHERLITIGAKVKPRPLRDFPNAEVAVSRRMSVDILLLIARLRAPPTPEGAKGSNAAGDDGKGMS
jgi:hypothetical protein